MERERCQVHLALLTPALPQLVSILQNEPFEGLNEGCVASVVTLLVSFSKGAAIDEMGKSEQEVRVLHVSIFSFVASRLLALSHDLVKQG